MTDDNEELSAIVSALTKSSYIDFVLTETGESYRHNQSNFEIDIPSVGSTIYTSYAYKNHKYIVESVEWGDCAVIVRLREESA